MSAEQFMAFNMLISGWLWCSVLIDVVTVFAES